MDPSESTKTSEKRIKLSPKQKKVLEEKQINPLIVLAQEGNPSSAPFQIAGMRLLMERGSKK